MNMNRIASFKISILVLFALLVSTPVFPKLLKPSENGEKKEILLINSKRRLYYSLDEDGLTYTFSGPTRIELISRYPSPKRDKNRHAYSYSIILDEDDPITVNHRYKIQKSIRSVQHPNHYYTYSGNYFINVPKGQHTIRLKAEDDQDYPILIRVLSKEFDNTGGEKKVLIPMVHQLARQVKVESSVVEYFEGNHIVPLQVSPTKDGTIRIYSRLVFDDWMGEQEAYRLRVRSGTKVIGTYYFSTERSSEAVVVEDQDSVPGKWRTCDIPVEATSQIFTIEVVEKDRKVLMRFLEF